MVPSYLHRRAPAHPLDVREHASLVPQVRFRKLGDKPPQHRPAHQPQPRARIGARLVLVLALLLLLMPVQVQVVLVLVLLPLVLLPLLPLLLALLLQLLPPLLPLVLVVLLQLPPPRRLSQPPRHLQRGGIGKFSIGPPPDLRVRSTVLMVGSGSARGTSPPLDHQHRRS